MNSCVLWLDSRYFTESYWWDISCYRNNGTIHGATWKNDGFYFNGNSNYISCGSNESLNITTLSIEVLVEFETLGQNAVLVSNDVPEEAGDALAIGTYEGKIYVGHVDYKYGISNENSVLKAGKKQHWVVTWERNTQDLHFYVNGEEKSLTYLADYWHPYGGDVEIGARKNGTQCLFKGKIYLVRIYNKILSETEVKILFDSLWY